MNNVAFLFPGQGAQAVGMGKDFADASPAAAAVFAEASDVLGWDVAAVCFEGPKEELDRTAISQPAILTTSLATVAAMKEAGLADVEHCSAAAGLSLGEYSALVMAGAITIADAVYLVQKRGQFMEEACHINPGTMLSVIGLEDGIVEAICAEARSTEMVVAANFNCPGQVVISGTRTGVARAAELAKEHGAKRAIPLAVGGAFHSPLMEPAAERLTEELERTTIKECAIPVTANVTAEPIQTPDEIRRSLTRQLTRPVRWTKSMLRIIEDKRPRFIEVAPGKVLAGLMRRIDRESEVESISTMDALRAKMEG